MIEMSAELIEKKEDKIRNMLVWVGTFATLLAIVVYLVIVVILVFGFESKIQSDKLLMFSILNAVVGLLISNFLRLQGVALAKSTDEAKLVLDRFKRESKVKHRSIGFMSIVAFIKDLFTKALTVGASSYLVVYIFIEGLGDMKYIGLAISNVVLFVGFGLIALGKSYDYYLEHHLPYLENKIKEGVVK